MTLTADARSDRLYIALYWLRVRLLTSFSFIQNMGYLTRN